MFPSTRQYLRASTMAIFFVFLYLNEHSSSDFSCRTFCSVQWLATCTLSANTLKLTPLPCAWPSVNLCVTHSLWLLQVQSKIWKSAKGLVFLRTSPVFSRLYFFGREGVFLQWLPHVQGTHLRDTFMYKYFHPRKEFSQKLMLSLGTDLVPAHNFSFPEQQVIAFHSWEMVLLHNKWSFTQVQ